MSELEVNMQVPSSSPKFNTDGRTDGLTKKVVTEVDQLSVATARDDHDSIAQFGDVLAASEPGARQRHEVIRSGEREEIPPHIRAAVYSRDGGKCSWCGHRVETVWHLDHITPWSAGGPDKSSNLRVLCERHNIERSNYVDHERQRMAATWWCVRCYDNDDFHWSHIGDIPVCGTHRADPFRPGRCPVARGYQRWRELHGEWPTWHKVGPITPDEPLSTAWCAHCYAPGLTSRPL